ncbi:exonuclease SbcCD subunit D C-terminal domain-containing protein [Chitinivibrio alkaliphilus]|uniref:Nuclease SbcCD subunit D n=1 Tax=Chitinivibrio alkaliphilus ACht1 TaxID=1313304 RepID=U7DBK3_9BACT|nr:exonuclease SbcCD subunit D C-terminal domain-containing protein [Chitinivibrio alkaliphilus]ERP39407.1 nuclease SbcCD, D subunit [Chitinivibrio alkaliphilus ACht1]
MKLLHTSDWHLGRMLYGQKRYEEFEAFLLWLKELLKKEACDGIIIAGDIFDTPTPSNRAQELYYSFLAAISSLCRHIIIIGGNHDSPTFLDAPCALLRSLQIHVVGAAPSQVDDEIICLRDSEDAVEAVVCAVPYLRDRDIRTASAEGGDDTESLRRRAVSAHYAKVISRGETLRQQAGSHVPLIVTGHLFTAGGTTVDGDGVRELYVGSLDRVSADIFPDTVDYVALGHLHVPQRVQQREHIRYSGSPIPMGFNEAKQEKQVVCLTFTEDSSTPCITTVFVPEFQKLERIRGDVSHIQERLRALSAEKSRAWVEVEYTGDEIIHRLQDEIEAVCSGPFPRVIRIKNRTFVQSILPPEETESLEEMSPEDVFEKCLVRHDVSPKEQEPLRQRFSKVLRDIYEEDRGGADHEDH